MNPQELPAKVRAQHLKGLTRTIVQPGRRRALLALDELVAKGGIAVIDPNPAVELEVLGLAAQVMRSRLGMVWHRATKLGHDLHAQLAQRGQLLDQGG